MQWRVTPENPSVNPLQCFDSKKIDYVLNRMPLGRRNWWEGTSDRMYVDSNNASFSSKKDLMNGPESYRINSRTS
jgi:hypothetical protein